MSEFEGKVVLITGGTSGIGKATAKAFAANGAKVVFTGRREAEGAEIEERIRRAGGDSMFFKADVRNPEDVTNMVSATIEKYGKLDIAFNNAGVEQYFQPLVEQKIEIYDLITETNIRGIWLSMKAEVPALLESGGGVIVNTSSVFGVVGAAMAPLYSASKHAVIGLTKSVALELAKSGIRVNALLPAAIETPMIDRFAKDEQTQAYLKSLHPIGRLGQSEEVAKTVLWMCSENSSFVTGTSIRVDGGFTAQ